MSTDAASRLDFALVRSDRAAPVISDNQNSLTVTLQVATRIAPQPVPPAWLTGFATALFLVSVLLLATIYLLVAGVGIWGVNVPVAWGFAIVNFVWWIGLGHAGTLISAVLFLLRQEWRRSISRIAESMTLFALTCAGLFPLLHLGRPWFFYWLLPYPNSMGIGPQFRSALVWDVFAILAYLLVSILFWYLGLIPDLATLRDRAAGRWPRRVFGALAMGWRGEALHWQRYEVIYKILAGLATALVISVHSIVALDFAITQLPGWHSTVFPPYFVAGAMHSGFAMVLLLVVPLRRLYGFHDYITERHFHNLARLMIVTAVIVGYGYGMEVFGQWYSGRLAEWQLALIHLTGSWAPVYWSLILANVLTPQLFWFARFRTNPLALCIVGATVLAGMWLERYIIVISSLSHDFLLSSWGPYRATVWDWALFLGTFGLFFSMFLLFVRWLPMLPMFELKQLIDHRSRLPH